MLVRAGSAQDPTDKPGVAEMVATLLDQGTTTRSAAEIADIIDFMGGGLGTGAGTDLSFANTILLQSNLDEGLAAARRRHPPAGLLGRGARAPARAAAVGAEGQLPGSGLRRRRGGRAADLRLPSLRQAGQRDAGIGGGADARRSRRASTRSGTHPNNTLIAIVGDVSVDDRRGGGGEGVRRLAEGHGAGVDARPIRPTRRGASSSSIGRARCRPRSASASSPSARDHQDYMPLNLAVKILGGEGGNRLQGVLRSDRGLTYGASAEMDAFQRSGADRRRHRHADRDDGRGAAPDRRRVHPAAAGGGRPSASWTRRRRSSPATSR